MAKKVASVAHQKKPIEQKSKRKKLRSIFKKILDYIKSDSYMFAPLLSSTATFNGEGFDYEPIEGNKKKLLWEFKDYMKSDCYLYAPFVKSQPWLHSSNIDTATSPIGAVHQERELTSDIHGDQQKKVTEKMRGLDSDSIQENRQENIMDHSPSTSTIVKHVVVQRETVKHGVQRSHCSPFVPGEMHAGEKRSRILVE